MVREQEKKKSEEKIKEKEKEKKKDSEESEEIEEVEEVPFQDPEILSPSTEPITPILKPISPPREETLEDSLRDVETEDKEKESIPTGYVPFHYGDVETTETGEPRFNGVVQLDREETIKTNDWIFKEGGRIEKPTRPQIREELRPVKFEETKKYKLGPSKSEPIPTHLIVETPEKKVKKYYKIQ